MCSARLDSLLDCTRLADCAANDAAMGFAPSPPPVEMDDAFFADADLAYARERDSGKHERDRARRALKGQVAAEDQGRL